MFKGDVLDIIKKYSKLNLSYIGFVAPELLSGVNLDCRTKCDIYSAGVVLGTLLEPYIPDCRLSYLGGSMVRVETTNEIVASLRYFTRSAIENAACPHSSLIRSYGSVMSSSSSSLESLLSVNQPNSFRCSHCQAAGLPPIVYCAADLLALMLDEDPTVRPSASELLSHPFLNAETQDFTGTDIDSYMQKRITYQYYSELLNRKEGSETTRYR